jgi:ABC-2 type transport system permease protein
MKVMRLIYLKGSAFVDLKGEFFALTGFAIAFNAWAILSYKKRV